MTQIKTTTGGWAVKWREDSWLDGKSEYLIGRFGSGGKIPDILSGYITMVFKTREQARKFVKRKFGYIRKRPDLRREPHGWKMPVVVKVNVTVEEI